MVRAVVNPAIRLIRALAEAIAGIGARKWQLQTQISVCDAGKEAHRNIHPAGQLTYCEIDDHIIRAIERLPVRLRIVLVMRYVERKKREDVARELGISRQKFDKLMSRAIVLLWQRLKSEGIEIFSRD